MKYDSGIFCGQPVGIHRGLHLWYRRWCDHQAGIGRHECDERIMYQFSVRLYGSDYVGGIGIQEHACRQETESSDCDLIGRWCSRWRCGRQDDVSGGEGIRGQ